MIIVRAGSGERTVEICLPDAVPPPAVDLAVGSAVRGWRLTAPDPPSSRQAELDAHRQHLRDKPRLDVNLGPIRPLPLASVGELAKARGQLAAIDRFLDTALELWGDEVATTWAVKEIRAAIAAAGEAP